MKRYTAALLTTFIAFNTLALDDFDLYKYGDTEINIERQDFIVKLILFKNNEELTKAYSEVTGKPIEESNIRAFTSVSPTNDVCLINIVAPEIWDDREALTIIGHELMHCGLASHQDAAAETAEREKEWNEEQKNKAALANELQNIEDLYAEDRKLELEWLKEDYEKMGIVIDEDPVTVQPASHACNVKDVVVEKDVIDTAVNVGLITKEEAIQLRKDIADGKKDVIDVNSDEGIISFGTITYDDDQ
jgi:hypothetical protein